MTARFSLFSFDVMFEFPGVGELNCCECFETAMPFKLQPVKAMTSMLTHTASRQTLGDRTISLGVLNIAYLIQLTPAPHKRTSVAMDTDFIQMRS